MIKYDAESGFKGLKQIYKTLCSQNLTQEDISVRLSKHSGHYLDRCFLDWMRREHIDEIDWKDDSGSIAFRKNEREIKER